MATKSRTIKDSSSKNECNHIHIKLLEEAINGLADLKAGKTLSLAQITSRHRGKRLSREQRLRKALQPLKGFLKGDNRPWPYQ